MSEQNILRSITELAHISNLSRAAIHLAIQKKRLKAVKDGKRWLISDENWISYQRTKYSRDYSKTDTKELLFNPSEGRFSVNQAANELKTSPHRIYYLIYMGLIQPNKYKCHYILSKEDLAKVVEYGT